MVNKKAGLLRGKCQRILLSAVPAFIYFPDVRERAIIFSHASAVTRAVPRSYDAMMSRVSPILLASTRWESFRAVLIFLTLDP